MSAEFAKYNFIEVAHDVAGRIRFAIPAIKGSPAQAQALGSYVAAIRGVTATRTSSVTGSLIVEYAGAAQAREGIFAALHQAGYRLRPRAPSRGPAKPSSSWDSTVTGTFARTVARMVAEEALRTAVLAII
ncbi:MAG: hypothetical protein JO230_06580 [Xanthobacteraceae bacterium]|nr:hypothetical protein [Xanthobacteraceae bacterium]